MKAISGEQQYLNLLQTILDTGIKQSNRTGIDTLTLPGAMLKFDLRDGFPAVTTKQLAFKSVVGELIGFLRGCTSSADFRALGSKVWDQNANENKQWLANPYRKGEDDLGRVYGKQWRDWQAPGEFGDSIDQIAIALNKVRNDPTDRRIIVTAWNPGELDQMALPPCHMMFQLLPHADTKVLHMTMYQRSCDMFLGVPFNIASYALLLELFSQWTGYIAGTLTMFLADAHIYENHIDQVKEQLLREPRLTPTLNLWDALPDGARAQLPLETLLDALHPDAIRLEGYAPHPPIKAPMAV